VALSAVILVGERLSAIQVAGLLIVSTATVTRSIAAAALSILAYGLVLWAQTRGALAVVAALRETSVVFAALLGAAVFGEQLPGRRVTASVAIAAGAVLLAVA